MDRAYRLVWAAGGLMAKAAVGFVGLIVVIGVIGPAPRTDQRARSDTVDPVVANDTVVLTVPEGSKSRTLTVVDGSGRELARLTRLSTNDTHFVATRPDAASVSCYLNARGPTVLLLAGTNRETHIEVDPDGTTKSSSIDILPFVKPPTIPAARVAEVTDLHR